MFWIYCLEEPAWTSLLPFVWRKNEGSNLTVWLPIDGSGRSTDNHYRIVIIGVHSVCTFLHFLRFSVYTQTRGYRVGQYCPSCASEFFDNFSRTSYLSLFAYMVPFEIVNCKRIHEFHFLSDWQCFHLVSIAFEYSRSFVRLSEEHWKNRTIGIAAILEASSLPHWTCLIWQL